MSKSRYRPPVNRSAKAQCCVAYWDGNEPQIFLGECAGEVLVEPRGEQKFGWDAWFKPHGSSLTFAEMQQFCRDAGLMTQKIPEQLEVVDVLPRNATFKILKHELVKQFKETSA